MKQTLQRYIDLAQKTETKSGAIDSPGTHGLTPQEVVKIGRHFSADYIVRGRIIQYKDRQDPSWNPAKKGVITFVTGVTSKLAFGQAESEKYDEWNNTLAGASNAASISALTNDHLSHVIGWGSAGAVLGNLAHHSGKIPQAVVQLRIWVQDAYTGNVVWTNRIDVKVSPESVLADYQYDALFEKATEQAISTLVDDFAQAIYKPAPVAPPVSPDSDKDSVPDVADHCPNTPVGVPVNALGCPAKENHILEGVNFDFDSAVLTQASQQILDRTASALIHAPHVKVEVAGFTDSIGDARYNLNLSNERSLSVVRYLTSKGVAASQLIAKGYGEEHPIADNATEEGRQKNRRTELRPMAR
jgi:outer membrane protein OmpA-like peptidoglycan-associated protein